MTKKAKAGDKVKVKQWENSLLIVDVSAHMRTNDAGDLPSKKEEANTEAEDLFFNRQKKPPKFQRKVLSTEVNGEEMVITSLYKLMEMFKVYGTQHTWVFCFDTPGKNMLKNIDKNYKSNRVKIGNYYYSQVNTAKKLLEEAGFTVLAKEGFEADHCVREAVRQNYDFYDNIGIFTNDHDLSYLVDDKVSWLNVKKTYADIHTDNYFEQNKCPYNSILLKKAMVGDKSDEIAGIKQFGEKKFITFLDDENLHGVNARGKEEEIIRNSTNLTDLQKEQALHAWTLVKPYDVDIDATANDQIDGTLLKAFFKKYQFKSLYNIFD